jgi:hypothetical protein
MVSSFLVSLLPILLLFSARLAVLFEGGFDSTSLGFPGFVSCFAGFQGYGVSIDG